MSNSAEPGIIVRHAPQFKRLES